MSGWRAGDRVDRQPCRGSTAHRARRDGTPLGFRDGLLDMADAVRRAGSACSTTCSSYRHRAGSGAGRALIDRCRELCRERGAAETGVGDRARQHHGATSLRRYRRREVHLAQLRTRRLITARSPLRSRGRPAGDQPVARATMFAMWRVGAGVRGAARVPAVSRSRAPARGRRPKASPTQRYGAAAAVGQLRAASSVTRRAIPTAQCGTVSVPVDYAKPEGRTSPIGRHPGPRHRRSDRRADGQPRRTWRVGRRHRRRHGRRAGRHRHRAGASIWSASTRAASATPRRSCAAAPTREFDAYRREPMADYSPARRRAHRGSSTAVRPVRASTRWAPSSSPTSGPRRRPATWTSCAPRWARTRSTISASPTAPSSARPTPSGTPTGCGRWSSTAPSTPPLGPDRRDHPPDGGVPNGFQRLRRRLRDSPAGCPLGTDPAQFVAPLPPAGRPAGAAARPRRPIRAA